MKVQNSFIKKRLDEKLVQTTFESTEEQYKYILENIHEAAKETSGEINTRRKPYYYWNEEIEQDIKVKKEKYLKWLNTKSIEDKIAFKKAQAQIRYKVAQEKSKNWEKECLRINSLLGGKRISEAWRTLKNLRANSKEKQVI